MADLFIVGQFEGVSSTTAVSIGSQVMHMLTVMIVGLAMGTTVSIAQAVGAGEKKRVAQSTGNTVTLFMSAGADGRAADAGAPDRIHHVDTGGGSRWYGGIS